MSKPPVTPPIDPALDGAHMEFDGGMSYGGYLDLDRLLNAQHPKSTAHDEVLFIIQHQATELWMKLVVHELLATIKRVQTDHLRVAFKMLARVNRIFDQLNQSWEILATLTPSEYSQFRPSLGQSSGFQSWQYRAIEFLAGNKNAAMMRLHAHEVVAHTQLDNLLKAPSLYDESLRVLARRGFAIDPDWLQRDFSQPYVANASVEAAWLAIYRNPEKHWDLYELGEELVDFEGYFRQWRFRHVTTVERIIGFKRGTGGTSGVGYLQQMLNVRLFPELWDLRTNL